MRKTISVEFDERERVYLKASPERKMGFVIGWVVISGVVQYRIAWESGIDDHYPIELSREYTPDYVQDALES